MNKYCCEPYTIMKVIVLYFVIVRWDFDTYVLGSRKGYPHDDDDDSVKSTQHVYSRLP